VAWAAWISDPPYNQTRGPLAWAALIVCALLRVKCPSAPGKVYRTGWGAFSADQVRVKYRNSERIALLSASPHSLPWVFARPLGRPRAAASTASNIGATDRLLRRFKLNDDLGRRSVFVANLGCPEESA
jgi:hypothetical protein